MSRDTLIDFFDDLAKAHGEFLVHDDGFRTRSYSYAQVGRAARGFAARLAAAGLHKGDKVLFWSENRPEWVVAFWGCLLSGVVVVPIDYRSSFDFLARIGRTVAAKLALIGEDTPPLTTALDLPAWRLHELEWRDGSPPAVAVSRDDVAEIIFTSGATGDPKGVVITHRNVLANIVPVEREVKKYRAWARPVFPLRFLNLLPLSHMFGQAMATFIPPMLPGTVIFMRGYNPADIVTLIRRRRVSVLVSVPKILDVLRAHVLRVAPDAGVPVPQKSWLFRWWRYRHLHRLFGFKFWSFVVGAAPLDAELEAFWSGRGFAVIQGYGLTETAPIVSVTHPFHIQAGSVGKAIAGVDVMIAPDGEILVRGENVTSGYFRAEAETAKAFEGGWFHTGDIGEIGPDGRLFIRGRKKEVIVTPEGLKVFPDDIERVVNQIPGVRDSAAVGVASGSEAAGERVHAVLVLEPGVDPLTVVRDANARLESHQKIRRARVWPQAELPRTEGTGKLKRAAIREWVRTGAAPIAAGPAADTLLALVAKYAGRGDLSSATTMDELGLGSLERVELMVALEDAFQTRVDEKAFSGAQDVGQLRALVEEASTGEVGPVEALEFPAWNRSFPARAVRRIGLPGFILPLTRVFAWIRVEGREHLDGVEGPVIFASSHQSFMDTPVIMSALPRRWRYRLAPAMAKEFFAAHFFPQEHGRLLRLATSVGYYLAALVFNAFPLPQREAGAGQTLRYMGDLLEDGFSLLIKDALLEVQEYVRLQLATARGVFARPFYFYDVVEQFDQIGVRSLTVVLLTGLFTGAVVALQTGITLDQYGARPFVGRLVSVSIITEVGPVFTGLMLAGRAGSGIAAELGSMAVTDQINALRALGTDPVRKLVVPRVLAGFFMAPALTVIYDTVGILGGWLVAVYQLRVASSLYWLSITEALALQDAWMGLIKPFILGYVIVTISCHLGLRTKGGTQGVGRATTRTVVAASVAVIVVDFFLSRLLITLLY